MGKEEKEEEEDGGGEGRREEEDEEEDGEGGGRREEEEEGKGVGVRLEEEGVGEIGDDVVGRDRREGAAAGGRSFFFLHCCAMLCRFLEKMKDKVSTPSHLDAT